MGMSGPFFRNERQSSRADDGMLWLDTERTGKSVR
jgi:hypothetical protein